MSLRNELYIMDSTLHPLPRASIFILDTSEPPEPLLKDSTLALGLETETSVANVDPCPNSNLISGNEFILKKGASFAICPSKCEPLS
jgi:hypothetical protein